MYFRQQNYVIQIDNLAFPCLSDPWFVVPFFALTWERIMSTISRHRRFCLGGLLWILLVDSIYYDWTAQGIKTEGMSEKKQLSISPRKGNQADKWGTEKNLWTSMKIKLTTNKLNWLLYCWQMGSSSSTSFKLYVIYLSSLPIKLQPPCLLWSSHGLLLQVPPVNTVSISQNRYDCTKNMEQFTQSYQVLWICFHFEAMYENHFFFWDNHCT